MKYTSGGEMDQVRRAILAIVPARKDRAAIARCPRCAGWLPPTWKQRVKAVLNKRLF